MTKGGINVLRAMAERLGTKLMEQKAKFVFSSPKETGREVVMEDTVDVSREEEEMQ